VRRYQDVMGRLRLVRPVGTTEALDRLLGNPSRLHEVVDALALVLVVQGGVVAPSRAASVGEDEDLLFVGHEGVGVALAVPLTTALKGGFPGFRVPHDPLCPSRHFRNSL